MSHEHEARRADAEAAAPVVAAAGRRSLVASRYPALAQALGERGGGGGGEPTIHDAATAAVEHKDGGGAVDPGVAARVGAHLGVDFSGVRVHSDPLAQQATAAMGARAFAYGSDVFLGAGESGGDVGLMAHELTHVAQQGAAGQRAVQRRVQVGDADSPAEREADQVAAQVTGGQGRPASLLVDDGPVGPDQMLKSQFFEHLRAQVTAAADAELGPTGSAIGCPPIEQYFGRAAGQPAAAGMAQLNQYAPGTRGVTTAAAMIPIVVARVREGVRQWRETGQAPDQLASALPAGGPVAAAMGAGQPMDAATASRMTDALGDDVVGAQIHLGSEAQAFAARHGALAVTVGSHVAFAAGAYQPGTIEGDALLAHELGHVAQQKGAGEVADPGAVPEAGAALEEDADRSAAGAVARLWSGAKGVAHRAAGAAKSSLALARCPGGTTRGPTTPTPTSDMSRVPAGPAREAAITLQASTAAIDQNTVRRLSDGTLSVAYIEDLAHAPDEATILAAQTPPLSSPAWSVLIHPVTNQRMLIPQNAQGFQQSGYVFGLRSELAVRWRTILVHEMNHAVNADSDAAPNSFARYRGEFRAYWVAEYSRVADLDERARQIKAHILADYPALNAQYTTNATFRGQVDALTRPDGNLDNH